jgi:transposase InsO family protein
MTYPLVTDLAADGVPVAVTCRVLKFSKQGYYRWRTSPVTERDWADAHLIDAAMDIHADDPAFGYRFIADELPAKGITAGENRVQRLCNVHGIWSVFSKKRGLNRRPGPPVHDDLVERDFTAAAPNELWLTDITEHPTLGFQSSSQHRFVSWVQVKHGGVRLGCPSRGFCVGVH